MEYSQVFNYSLKKGHLECAKLLYPYVGSFEDIHITKIITSMISSLTKRLDITRINEILQNYIDVFEFLQDINYRISDNEDKLDTFFELFDLTCTNYQTFGTNPLYKQIIGIIYEICDGLPNEDIAHIQHNPSTYHIQMMDELDLLNEHNIISIINYFCVNDNDKDLDFMIAFDIFLKYHGLNDSNMNLLFKRFVGSYHNTQQFHSKVSRFLKFMQNKNFRLNLDETVIPDISDVDTIELILNAAYEIIINNPVKTSHENTFQLLLSRNIEAILIRKNIVMVHLY